MFLFESFKDNKSLLFIKLNIAFFVNIFNKITYYIVLKRVFSILLALILIFNSAGYIVVFYQMKKYFKKEAFQKLENYIKPEDLTTIVISKYDFENENENFYFIESKEIKYFGKMYDIARIEHTGDSVRIIALNDENEDNLHNLFAQFFTKNLNDKYSKTASIIKLIITDAGLPIIFDSNASWREDLCYNFIFVPILKNFFDVPTPPPKCFS